MPKDSIVTRETKEFREWLKERQKNFQKLLPYGKITMMETQRIIAQTNGVEITNDLLKKMGRKFK